MAVLVFDTEDKNRYLRQNRMDFWSVKHCMTIRGIIGETVTRVRIAIGHCDDQMCDDHHHHCTHSHWVGPVEAKGWISHIWSSWWPIALLKLGAVSPMMPLVVPQCFTDQKSMRFLRRYRICAILGPAAFSEKPCLTANFNFSAPQTATETNDGDSESWQQGLQAGVSYAVAEHDRCVY